VSEVSLGSWDIIDLIRLFGLCLIVPVFLGASSWNVRNVHSISDELRRGNGSGIYLLEMISR